MTVLYLVVFYLVPMFLLPGLLPVNKTLFKSFVQSDQVGSFMYSKLGGTLDFRGVQLYFLTLREAFLFSVIATNKVAGAFAK